MKLNIKGLIALIVWVVALVLVIYDFYQLTQGATYTWYGLATLGFVLFMGCEAENYMHERINRR